MEPSGAGQDKAAGDLLELLDRVAPGESGLAKRGFRLSGLGEEGTVVQTKELPAEWREQAGMENARMLRYRHSRSSLSFLVTFVRISPTLLAVHALTLEDTSHSGSLTLTLDKYLSASFTEGHLTAAALLPRALSTLAAEVRANVFPSVSDPDASDATPAPAPVPAPARVPEPQPRQPDYDPLRIGPPREPYRYESECELMVSVDPPWSGGVGRGDLEPFPTAPYPGGGPLVGPGHPMFGPDVRDPYALPGSRPPFPGAGRGRVPGARFDPYGPPGFNRPWPDNDELPPPGGGWDDMFM